jgi:hypothetical protein
VGFSRFRDIILSGIFTVVCLQQLAFSVVACFFSGRRSASVIIAVREQGPGAASVLSIIAEPAGGSAH